MTTPLALPFDAPLETSRQRKAGHVRETSVLAKQALDVGPLHQRAAAVREWLLLHPSWDAPTSAELAQWRWRTQAHTGPVSLECVLYVRRGLSELQTRGVVEAVPHGKRKCRVTGRTCETWRLRQR